MQAWATPWRKKPLTSSGAKPSLHCRRRGTNLILPTFERVVFAVTVVAIAIVCIGTTFIKRRAYVVATNGDPEARNRFSRENGIHGNETGGQRPRLSEYQGRSGIYFLKRRGGRERELCPLDYPIVTVTHAHILGDKPESGACQRDPWDPGEADHLMYLIIPVGE